MSYFRVLYSLSNWLFLIFLLQGKRQTWYNSTLASRRKRLTAHFEDLEQCYFSNKMSRITGTDVAKSICTPALLLLARSFEWGMEKENKKHPKEDLVSVSPAAWHCLALSKEHQAMSNQIGEGGGGHALAFWLRPKSRHCYRSAPPSSVSLCD